MLIELTNFRCWEKNTFEFPDIGLILLSGVSGAGKTSILSAIHFALYGIGKKIVTIGKKNCKVRLVLKEFDVIRENGNNRIKITYKGEHYEGDVAQKIIDKHFGTNFTITSYITQKTVQSFFNMGPTDKMKFLEQIALGEENITDIKKTTKEKIKQRKETLLQKIGQLEVISKEVEEMKKPIELPFPLGGKHSDIKISNEDKRWKKTIKELQKKNTEKRKVETDLSNEKVQRALREKQQKITIELEEKYKVLLSKKIDYDGDENLNDMKSTLSFLKNKREFTSINDRYNEEKKNFDSLLQQEVDNLQREKDKLQEELNSLEEVSDEELKILEDQLSSKKKEVDLKNKLEAEQKKLEKISDVDEEDISILEDDLVQLQKNKLDVEQRTNIKTCPCCKVSLILSHDELVSIENKPINKEKAKVDLEIILKETTSIKKRVDVLKKDLILRNELNKKIIGIKNELRVVEKRNNNEITGLIEDIYDRKKNVREQRVQLQKGIKNVEKKIVDKELSSTLKKLLVQLESRKKELDKIKTQLEEDIETDYTEEELQGEISKQLLLKQKSEELTKQVKESNKQLENAKKELDKIVLLDRDFDNELSILSTEIKELESKNEQHKKTHEEIQKYQKNKELVEDYKKWENKLKLCKEEEKKAKKLLSTTETFLRKIQEAESIAILQTIESINYYMNFYLEKFFPDNPITVDIRTYKETKNDIKPSINIEVGYKGVETDLSSLSGGEYDRVTLSIVLALNNIFGSNLLMLDESISSLDEGLTNEILDVLKEHLQEKLVIVVAHQIGDGVFDNVVKVGE